ncbi:hypothetical protein BKA24_001731 [Microbacterium marinum]|uniref:Mu-like prophage protein gp29 n=1 Tax=Microbacterium marinum TaxID=421115 RepID=A0A7W7BQM7_9MICO|nr:hypothetical protein [Microbacterium marinum]MBB4667022.1 hypothetical protein [Microbacterium marinum]
MSSELRAFAEDLAESLTEAHAAGNEAGVELLTEHFDRIMGMLKREDRGWNTLFGGDEDSEFGLTLSDLKQWAAKIEEAIPGAPWMGRGFRLRRDFIWKGGIQYGNLPEGGTQGLANIKKKTLTDQNQREFFAPSARHRRERRLFSSSIALWIGNDKTKQLESLPLRQVTGQLTDPNGLGQIWAYLREWTKVDLASGRTTHMKKWYFVEEFKDKRVLNIKDPAGQRIPVDQDHVIFDQHANRADGFAYGSPDALAAFIWNGIVRDAYMDGLSVTGALARFAYKATAKNKKAADNAAMEYANAETAGGMAIVGGANDLTPLSSAGKGYDFSTLRAVLAVMATSLDVTAIALSADSSDEGGSASAATLDLPTRLAMTTRRDEHVELDIRVLKWLGMKEQPDVQFLPYDASDETYRVIQGFMLGYQNNLYTEQEARDFVDNLLGLPHGTPPSGAKRPFGDLSGGGKAALPQTASPNQGKSNGTGGQQGGNASNDIQDDSAGK